MPCTPCPSILRPGVFTYLKLPPSLPFSFLPSVEHTRSHHFITLNFFTLILLFSNPLIHQLINHPLSPATMRFSSIVLSVTSIAAFAAAQSATSTTSSIPPNPTYVCVAACPAGDVSCQAECMGIPSPDEAAVNATTACAANCEQGVSSKIIKDL